MLGSARSEARGARELASLIVRSPSASAPQYSSACYARRLKEFYQATRNERKIKFVSESETLTISLRFILLITGSLIRGLSSVFLGLFWRPPGEFLVWASGLCSLYRRFHYIGVNYSGVSDPQILLYILGRAEKISFVGTGTSL